MAEATRDLDRWGHIASTVLDNGAVAGVMTGPGGIGRLVYTRNGDPSTGYDRVYWYETPEAALAFLETWDGMSRPEGFIRDCNADPLPFTEG